ncbi:MAG: S1 RNA-binding domain-containing protein [Candidatus Altiarchaeota archaeon]|nr:S1 RNA-binding domain-containing protein [Candidatus Altiarchaeota archaeon]
MKIRKRGLPEEGENVLVTVARVAPHAAFANLDEYEGLEGLIHISEVSKTWVKNIKSHVSVGQQLVVKAFQIRQRDGSIQLSVRRMSDYDMKAKWDQIRRQKRVENILEMLAKELKLSFEEVCTALDKAKAEFGEIYFAFEEMKKAGGSEGFKDKIPEKVLPGLWKLVDKNIALPRVEVSGIITLESRDGRGIEKIKEILKGLKGILCTGAGRYAIKTTAMDYKLAEKELESTLKKIKKRLGKTETFDFVRDKKK